MTSTRASAAEAVNLAVVGLGKMGLSHHALVNAHPDVRLAAVCDSSSYVLGVLRKYTGVETYSDYDRMLREVELDAVVVATPSTTHSGMVHAALEHQLDVFCEKPFTLSPDESDRLAQASSESRRVTQVGYHNRFVGAFQEVKRLLEHSAVGQVTHVLAEAYGPVVLRPTGGTWRNRRDQGGGCLYDYAAHPIDLLTWYFGPPEAVTGTALKQVFSRETEDEVYSTLLFPQGTTAQLSVNWSDESQRKMTTKITIWGTEGRIYADRQECQVYLRDTATPPPGYEVGWNVRYTTDLTAPVWFYLRGEEYSAQIDHFVKRVQSREVEGTNSFVSAAMTDRVIGMMLEDDGRERVTRPALSRPEPPRRRRWRLRRSRQR